MTDDVTSTWATRDLPILKLALRNLDTGQTHITALEGMRAELGFDGPTMRAGVRALAEADPPYISVDAVDGPLDRIAGYVTGVSERTRRELGTWPSPDSVIDQLVSALNAAAAAEPEGEKRGRLRSA